MWVLILINWNNLVETIEIVADESELNGATTIVFDNTENEGAKKQPNVMRVFDDLDMDYSARNDQSTILNPPPRKRSRIK